MILYLLLNESILLIFSYQYIVGDTSFQFNLKSNSVGELKKETFNTVFEINALHKWYLNRLIYLQQNE